MKESDEKRPRWWQKKRILATAGILAMLGGFEVQPYRAVVVNGSSMSPTYRDREVLATTRNTGKIERGDVVVIQGPSGPIMKRVALLPGDHFYRLMFTNGWQDLIQIRPTKNAGERIKQVTVPEGNVYVLGDNIINSEDSRAYGFIPVNRIIGKLLDQRPPDSLPDGLMAALSKRPLLGKVASAAPAPAIETLVSGPVY